MDQQTFELLQTQHKEIMGRFDKIEATYADHEKEDRLAWKMLERHTMYFNVAFLGLPILFGTLAKKFGFLPE
jgi:hypothetical protein